MWCGTKAKIRVWLMFIPKYFFYFKLFGFCTKIFWQSDPFKHQSCILSPVEILLKSDNRFDYIAAAYHKNGN